MKENESNENTRNKEKQKKSSKKIQDSSLLEEDLPINDLSSRSDRISDDDAGDSDFKLESYKYEGQKRIKKESKIGFSNFSREFQNETNEELTNKQKRIVISSDKRKAAKELSTNHNKPKRMKLNNKSEATLESAKATRGRGNKKKLRKEHVWN